MKTRILLTFLIFAGGVLFGAEPQSADVLVLSATPAGVSAAVAAARSGASVILLGEKNHVGGVVSDGLTNTDIYRKAPPSHLCARRAAHLGRV